MSIKSNTKQLPEKMLYDRQSAAWTLSISIRSLDYLLARKAIIFRRIGSKVLIPHSELLRYSRGNHFGPISGLASAMEAA